MTCGMTCGMKKFKKKKERFFRAFLLPNFPIRFRCHSLYIHSAKNYTICRVKPTVALMRNVYSKIRSAFYSIYVG